MKALLLQFYREWINNYITISKFAQDNGITLTQAVELLKIAKEMNDE